MLKKLGYKWHLLVKTQNCEFTSVKSTFTSVKSYLQVEKLYIESYHGYLMHDFSLQILKNLVTSYIYK